MTSAEFAESVAFEELEPDPAVLLVSLQAQTLTVLANALLRPTKPYTPADFLPKPAEGPAEKEAARRFGDVLTEMRMSYATKRQH